MKKSILFFLFLQLTLLVIGNDSNIEFRNVANLDEAITLSKKENKLVFIDCYIQSCGPCKQMDKFVFTNSEVAKFYNQHFICIKVDMGSEEWKSVRKFYEINLFPTYLFVDSNKAIQHMKIGIGRATDFIRLGKEANDFKNNYFASCQKISKGDRSAKILRKYFECNPIEKSRDETSFKFIEQAAPNEKFSEDAWYFLTNERNYPDSIFCYYILNYYEKYIPIVGEKEVIQYVDKTWSKKLGISNEYELALKRTIDQPIFPQVLANASVEKSILLYKKFTYSFNAQKLKDAANNYMNYTYLDYGVLLYAAQTIVEKYQTVKNYNYLKEALSWINRCIEDENNPKYFDIKADILFLMNEKLQAIDMEKTAIRLAENNYDRWGQLIGKLEEKLKILEN